MRAKCANKSCASQFGGPKSGFYVRKSDRKTLRRYRCRDCSKTFSAATHSLLRHQKKRQLNGEIWKRYCSRMTLRGIARLLKISRTTVARKIRFLESIKGTEHESYLKALESNRPDKVYIDEMRTFVHSVCKPVSIVMAVTNKRKILGFEISPIVPNSQRLIEIAKKKYGQPADKSREGFDRLLEKISKVIDPLTLIITDDHKGYPSWIKKRIPGAKHIKYSSRLEPPEGPAELKGRGYDPLFPINHTFAQFRDKVSRLTRKSWCTSKNVENLKAHLTLFMHFHNTQLT